MDDRGFDRLARQLARGGSRRGLLAGGVAALAALVGGVRTTLARPYSVPLGGVCYHDRQCIPAEPGPSTNIVYCADNGFEWDGEYNCCRYADGQCGVDADCCGTLGCFSGYCAAPLLPSRRRRRRTGVGANVRRRVRRATALRRRGRRR